MCKIHQYFGEELNRVWSLIFWPILNVKLCFVLDRLSVFVNIRRWYSHIQDGPKLSSKLLFIYSPNSDGFYIFYISQGSVATQLGVVVCLVTTLLQIFHRTREWKIFSKIGQYLTKIWTKLCGLLFGPPCIFNVECNALVDMTKPLSLTVSEIYLGNR